jgi:hypothetical protein
MGCSSSIFVPTVAIVQSTITQELSDQVTEIGTSSVVPEYGVAYGYQVAWKSADLYLFTPKSAPVLRLSATSIPSTMRTWSYTGSISWPSSIAVTTSTNPSLLPTPIDTLSTPNLSASVTATSTSNSKRKLSSHDMIAIEAGAVFGFILLVGGCAWLFLRPRLRKRE